MYTEQVCVVVLAINTHMSSALNSQGHNGTGSDHCFGHLKAPFPVS